MVSKNVVQINPGVEYQSRWKLIIRPLINTEGVVRNGLSYVDGCPINLHLCTRRTWMSR